MGYLENIRRKRTYAIFAYWIDEAFTYDSMESLRAYQFLIREPDNSHWSLSLLAFTDASKIMDPAQAAAAAKHKMIFEKRGKIKTPELIQSYVIGLIQDYLTRGPHREKFLGASSLSLRLADNPPLALTLRN
ncbi:MAG TPA: hypothetical protein PKY64_05220 [Anaerolineaceae bacterium]|nr:hypothetical protein [Anaerolineaceae bacterium]